MNKITIYTTNACPACSRAKNYLQLKGLEFTEVNIMESPENLNEALQVSGGQRQAPIIKINEEVISGFNQSKIDAALNQLLNE